MQEVLHSAIVELAQLLRAMHERGPLGAEPQRISQLVQEISHLVPPRGWTERVYQLVQAVLALPVFARDPAKRAGRKGYLEVAKMLEAWVADEGAAGEAIRPGDPAPPRATG